MPTTRSLEPVDSPSEAVSLRRLPSPFAKRHGVLGRMGAVVSRIKVMTKLWTRAGR
ncbi:hypothetical protein SZ55_0685 [Pseudomonas sp. FeS53a]|uniref:hypothetical protein n=1 Tax=Pseudomonas sp. FeS53a TaxID=1604022 RepID=UPI0005E57842|nr:hypothetical protein [Pseudomonas sp. FeS53a]KIV74548.1 hypothetical protein SZ55_0685 [Pseudomonas sp. FeS53a]